MTRALYLDGCREKILRAREHLDTLHDEITAFIDSGAYGVVAELNCETGWKNLAFEIHREPPIRWGVIVGDAGHNLRSALDHLVYELSGHKRSTAFPIFTSVDEYLEIREDGRSMRDRMLEGVPPAEASILDNYQPFQRIGDQSRDPLARLAWLNNADKHRVVHAAITLLSRFESLDVEFVDEGGEGIDVEVLFEPPIEVKDGTKLYRVRTRPDPAAKVEMHSELPFRIAFGKGSRFLETGDLRLIADYVESIVKRFV